MSLHRLSDTMAKDNVSSSMVSTLTSKLLTDPNIMAAFSNELNSMVGKSSGYIERLALYNKSCGTVDCHHFAFNLFLLTVLNYVAVRQVEL